MKDKTKLFTTGIRFDNIPAVDDDLFEVRAGIDIDLAINQAACLASSIECLATEAVQDGMSSEVAYLVAFAADAVQALVNSVAGAYDTREVQP